MEYKNGDYVLVTMGFPPQLLHAVARVGVGAALLLGSPNNKQSIPLDVCVGTNHLPQLYRDDEVELIREDFDFEAHGFCVKCKGFGLLDFSDNFNINQLLDGTAGTVCPDCNGGGRVGIIYTKTKTAGSVEVLVNYDPALMDLRCPICAASFRPQPKY